MPDNTSLINGRVGMMESAVPGYKPWENMSIVEKNICAAEVILGWERYLDVETKTVRWAKRSAYGEQIAAKDWPPNFLQDPKTTEELKRQFDTWEIRKLGSRHYEATVESVKASAVTDLEAFVHAAVLVKGACV